MVIVSWFGTCFTEDLMALIVPLAEHIVFGKQLYRKTR